MSQPSGPFAETVRGVGACEFWETSVLTDKGDILWTDCDHGMSITFGRGIAGARKFVNSLAPADPVYGHTVIAQRHHRISEWHEEATHE